MSNKIKIGLIGTGSISNEHINAYLKNSDVELYAFCDINEQQLNEMAKKYGITRTFTDMNEMLKLKEIDAVSVCTWNSAHAPFDNGAVLSIESSFSLNIKNDRGEIELFGTKAGAKLNPQLELYTEINGYMADVDLATDTALSFQGLFAKEIDHFVSCIKDNIPCNSPAQDGVDLMTVIDAIYESAKTGHEVILN